MSMLSMYLFIHSGILLAIFTRCDNFCGFICHTIATTTKHDADILLYMWIPFRKHLNLVNGNFYGSTTFVFQQRNVSPHGQNAAILQTTLPNAFWWWKVLHLGSKLFPKGPIENKSILVHVMTWRGLATNHELNQCWPSSLTHTCDTRGDEF